MNKLKEHLQVLLKDDYTIIILNNNIISKINNVHIISTVKDLEALKLRKKKVVIITINKHLDHDINHTDIMNNLLFTKEEIRIFNYKIEDVKDTVLEL